MNTIVFLLFLFFCILTFKVKVRTLYKILILPVAWLVHAALTIPAAMVLGILMHDPAHVRTAVEHRAVFILASLPVVVFLMNKSKVFTKEN